MVNEQTVLTSTPDPAVFKTNAFFVIGAPKCGTTSWAKHLSDHTEVAFSDPKEPHFFSSDYPFDPDGLATLESYLKLFPTTSEVTRFGEGSVFYLYSEDAVRRIEETTNKGARYIVCLRDPVLASFSLHAQHVAFGWEPERDYLKALRRSEAESLLANPDPKLAHVLRYAHFYRYGDHIERLLRDVDQTRIFFIVIERDWGDSNDLYARLHRFLGLSERQVDHEVRVNEARRIKSELIYRMLKSTQGLAMAHLARRLFCTQGFRSEAPYPQD